MSLKLMSSRILLLTLWAVAAPLAAAPGPTPLPRAHAHNDYNHTRPLFEALEQGFCSVEADIFLVNGKLLVAHNIESVKPERTLEALYLDPLRAQIRQHGGRVYPHGPECTLLIDLKQDWKVLYPPLRNVLTNYADILTTYEGELKHPGALRVVFTGSSSLEMLQGETVRYGGVDGTPADYDSEVSPLWMPWLSSDWRHFFKWNGVGTMPEAEAQQLAELVKKGHSHRRQVRFWGAPDNSNFWKTMLAAGVDLINTDNLSGLAEVLNASASGVKPAGTAP